MAANLVDPNHLLALALVLAAGVVAGALASRARLPSVTGQLLAGIVLGPAVLGLFSASAVHGLRPIIDFALGLMAVSIGSHLNWRRLGNAKRRLGWLMLLESVVTPTIVLVLVIGVGGAPWPLAVLLATISVSTAPATVLSVVKETRASGSFVKTLVAGVALNNLACITLFELARSVAAVEVAPDGGHTLSAALLAPARQLLLSGLLGGGVGSLLVLVTRRMARSDRVSATSLVAILLVAGLAAQFSISVLLSCLFLGVTLANLTPAREEIGHAVFANFEYAIFAVFFTLAGTELRFDTIIPGGLLAALVFVGRASGKLLGASLAMRLGRATDRLRRYLGLALIPQAGLAVGLMLLVTEDPTFASMHEMVLAVVLTVVLANEIAGPILTRFALARSGEAGLDRPRVLDFLLEQHILTDFRADSMDAAIRQLVDHLVKTHGLEVQRDEILDGVLARERDGFTYLGDGLATPHARVERGTAIMGVMGICRTGLRFANSEGAAVNCVVLLVVPNSQSDRYLQVLAALARAVVSDPMARDMLYGAATPAHAYELIHAADAAMDFNRFVDDGELESSRETAPTRRPVSGATP